ncbi:MAG: cytochrome P450 [Anaerolineales bacterium]|nr:cytochrome P450 [Anaerolineales bacterium]
MTAFSTVAEIPGPSPVPVLGWLPELVRFAFNPLLALENLQKKYGDVVRLGYGKAPAVIVFSPEYNRVVLRDPSVFYSYNLDFIPLPFPRDHAVSRVMNSMPFLNGPKHADHRAYMLPYFHRNFIGRHHDACVEVTERKLASWKMGEQIDLRSEMEQLAMWLATKPILGLDPEKEGEALGHRLENSLKLMFSPFALLFPYNIPGTPFHRLLKSAEELERVVKDIVATRKAKGTDGDDILSALIRLHEEDPARMSENDLIGHTIMFRGGYSPNGMALYWTILLLTQHPEFFKKVLAEIEQAMGEESPTPEQLDQLPLLDAALKETMRLIPAGIWTARYAMEPFQLGDYRLKKGTWVMMSAYVTHRIPDVFSDPYKFLPERWLTIHPSAYEFMSFSAGPRYCIGQPLAMMQLKIALSIILRRYSFTLKSGTKLDCIGLNSIRPKNGLYMTLGERGDVPSPAPLEGNIRKIVHFD